ncbi:MAG: inositol monophosphatase family protein [Pseudomonadota bacterium]|nr:inositol monophosphatase family protein [Pseudomonadota bacterium]
METLFDFFAQLSATARSTIDEAIGQGLDPSDKSVEGVAYDPVTEADRSVERALRSMIGARFPLDGIVGEEFGADRPKAKRVWSLDPIDGTRQLVCGLPCWTVLVALVEDGVPIGGMIDAPRLGELVVGDGQRALMLEPAGPRELRTSGVARLAEARLSTTDPYLFGTDAAKRFARLRKAARLTRFGLDGYAYARLAAGTIDLVAEAGLKPHDWQALVPVIRGAGGIVGNWDGGDELSAGEILAGASQALFDEAVAVLSSARTS